MGKSTASYYPPSWGNTWPTLTTLKALAQTTYFHNIFNRVKEMSKNDPKVETEIGNGCIDFKAIFANASLAGAKRFFIEQENNYVPDPFGSVKQSAAFTRKNLM